MAVNDETLRVLRQMRAELAGVVDAEAQAIIRAWTVAWAQIAPEWEAALLDLAATSTDGRWPSRRQVLRARYAIDALAHTRDALDELVAGTGTRVVDALPKLTGQAEQWQRQLIASQYPGEAGTLAQVMGSLAVPKPTALDAIVRRATQQVTSLHRPLSADATRAMKQTLIRGVAVGDNPRTAASRMLSLVQGRFEGGRNRALVIARTEMLDAHRAGSLASSKANRDVLKGWQWIATLDKRTCPSCWAMHGRTFPVDTPGPEDHQQGRCDRLPATKSWRDLGFDVDEPPSLLPDARQRFDSLSQADRLAIMGPKRLELLDTGAIGWDDLASKRSTSGWRDSYAPTPLSALTA